MTYSLKFLPSALKEWEKLGPSLREQFKKKLAERLQRPRIEKDRLSGFVDHYKIKLRAAGYRLVYEVIDREVVVLVIAVGKRDKNIVYRVADARKGRK